MRQALCQACFQNGEAYPPLQMQTQAHQVRLQLLAKPGRFRQEGNPGLLRGTCRYSCWTLYCLGDKRLPLNSKAPI